jgi:hypothetical protein
MKTRREWQARWLSKYLLFDIPHALELLFNFWRNALKLLAVRQQVVGEIRVLRVLCFMTRIILLDILFYFLWLRLTGTHKSLPACPPHTALASGHTRTALTSRSLSSPGLPGRERMSSRSLRA